MPYQVGKSGLVEKIAEAAKDKRIEGVADIRDESSRLGVRVVMELKRDASPEVVLNQLWRYTPAQSSFPANMLAIRGGRPETLALRDIIAAFIAFREEVITRRTKFELNKARDRAHILLGLVVAVTNMDEVVRIIRGARNPAAARAALLDREWPIGEIAQYIRLVEAIEDDIETLAGSTYKLSELQVKAILDLRLHRLTALGRDEIGDELQKLSEVIVELLAILADRVKLYGVMRAELVQVRESVRHAARLRNRPRLGRHRRRRPDRARRDGGDGHARRLYQAHRALDLPRAKPGRQGPFGHGDQGRGCGGDDVRHLDA